MQEKKERQRTQAPEGGEVPAKRPRVDQGGLAGQALPALAYMQPSDEPMSAAPFASHQVPMHQVLSSAAPVPAAEPSGAVEYMCWQQRLSPLYLLLAQGCGRWLVLLAASDKVCDVCKPNQRLLGPFASATAPVVLMSRGRAQPVQTVSYSCADHCPPARHLFLRLCIWWDRLPSRPQCRRPATCFCRPS